MKCFSWLVLPALALSLNMVFSSRYEQHFAIEPQDQTAIEGTKVTFPCKVVNKSGRLQWTKDDFALGFQRNLPGFNRYTMVGNDVEGDFFLEINPVVLDDEAKYQCQVGFGSGGEPGIRSRFARLTVLVPPEPPRIVQGSTLQTTEDREIELECVSAGGKPAAEITWIAADGDALSENIEYSKELMSDSRLYIARSVFKFTPKKKHHNTTFVCEAQNTAERMAQSAQLRLQVRYAPEVTVLVVEGAFSSGRIPEGGDVRFLCDADANPSHLSYKWFLDDKPIQPNATTELILTNVTRSLHNAIVRCQVYNAVGKSEESTMLDISYGPKFRQRPTSIVYADPGSLVTLMCDVDGHPPPKIEWLLIHEDGNRDDGKHMGYSPNLTFIADKNSRGRYYCKAIVDGFPEIGAEARVFLKGKPEIVSERMQFIYSGEARVECEAISVPEHERITWTHNGKEITKYDANYHFVEDVLPSGVKSTLIIRDSQDSVDGFNCSVTNAYGTDSIEICLVAPKTYPMVFIVTGVVGGVNMIALPVVLILCQRKDKNTPTSTPPSLPSPPAIDSYEVDRSSNISDNKSESLTGSSVSRALNETGSERGSEQGCGGIPPLSTLKTFNKYRLSKYPARTLPPKFKDKKGGQNNDGCVSYVNYSRDYEPPLRTFQIGNNVSTLNVHTRPLSALDPRHTAPDGNPYRCLRSSSVSLLPAHPRPAPSSSASLSTDPLDTGIPPEPIYVEMRPSPPKNIIMPSSQVATLTQGTSETDV